MEEAVDRTGHERTPYRAVLGISPEQTEHCDDKRRFKDLEKVFYSKSEDVREQGSTRYVGQGDEVRGRKHTTRRRRAWAGSEMRAPQPDK
uniref:Uncharacterized protein n=1 Tax=Oryza punctata TaxID=4537 RepID=A0A0E0K8A2_ORYPU